MTARSRRSLVFRVGVSVRMFGRDPRGLGSGTRAGSGPRDPGNASSLGADGSAARSVAGSLPRYSVDSTLMRFASFILLPRPAVLIGPQNHLIYVICSCDNCSEDDGTFLGWSCLRNCQTG